MLLSIIQSLNDIKKRFLYNELPHSHCHSLLMNMNYVVSGGAEMKPCIVLDRDKKNKYNQLPESPELVQVQH